MKIEFGAPFVLPSRVSAARYLSLVTVAHLAQYGLSTLVLLWEGGPVLKSCQNASNVWRRFLPEHWSLTELIPPHVHS